MKHPVITYMYYKCVAHKVLQHKRNSVSMIDNFHLLRFIKRYVSDYNIMLPFLSDSKLQIT